MAKSVVRQRHGIRGVGGGGGAQDGGLAAAT